MNSEDHTIKPKRQGDGGRNRNSVRGTCPGCQSYVYGNQDRVKVMQKASESKDSVDPNEGDLGGLYYHRACFMNSKVGQDMSAEGTKS